MKFIITAFVFFSAWMIQAATTYHVAPSGSPAWPYDSWDNASTSIQVALDVAGSGDTVLLTNGLYRLSTHLWVTNGVTLRGALGPAVTFIQPATGIQTRLMIISNTAAGSVVSGLTFRVNSNNTASLLGTTVVMDAGRLENCTFASNYCANNGSYSALWLRHGGVVSNCQFFGNSSWLNGGAVGLSTGTIQNSTFNNNACGGNPAYNGGAVSMAGGLIERCLFFSNTTANAGAGGAIYMGGGTVRNSIIRDNRGATAGGVYLSKGRLENCLVVRNTAFRSPYGNGMIVAGGTAVNCIVYYNLPASAFIRDLGNTPNIVRLGGVITNTCAAPLPGGSGNVEQEPLFYDLSGNDFRLLPGSPCLDKGVNLATFSNDYVGSSRPIDADGDGTGTFDMGPYEMAALNSGTLRCGFIATSNEGLTSMEAVFEARVGGANTNISWYSWDFNGDNTPDLSGADRATVTNPFGVGFHTVILIVTNSDGQAATNRQVGIVRVSPPTVYIATNGTPAAPFTNWATATTNWQAAIDLVSGGAEVWVSNGIYIHTQQIQVLKNIRMTSLAGYPNTILARSASPSNRLMMVCASNAVISGFTLTNGYILGADNYGYGAGLYLMNGQVENCLITKNVGGGNTYGGGVWITGGLLLNSQVLNNSAWMRGGGVYMDGGVIDRCRIAFNTWGRTDLAGGGIYINSAGLVKNSVIHDNTSGSVDGPGGGAYLGSGGQLVNCTIAHNVSGGWGGGVYRNTGGALTNCIVYLNKKLSVDQNYSNSLSGVWYSCSPEFTNPANANITSDPLFKNPGDRDYRLASFSLAIDAGIDLAGVTNDFDGLPRPINGDSDEIIRTDMGAYEMPDISGGSLQCDFSAPVTAGLAPLDVVFTASAQGNNPEIVWYGWDFDDDGVDDVSGSTRGVVTQSFTHVGWNHVRLTVSNTVNDTAFTIKSNFVYVAPATVYVATNGGHQFPFTNWAGASTSLLAAVAVAYDGTEIWVTNGRYRLTNELLILNHIRLRSINGADHTSLYAPGSPTIQRVLFLAATGAVVQGFTISNGYQSVGNGGGVYLTDGVLRDCTVISNRALNNLNGGGIYMTGGMVENCLVLSNVAWLVGGGIYQSGGLVLNSQILYNKSGQNAGQGAGGVNLTGGTLWNSLIAGNQGGGGAVGGGIIVAGGLVENCTVVGNGVGVSGGGVHRTSGGVTNTIVYYNSAPLSNNVSGIGGYGYSCAPELPHDPAGTGNITNAPLFKATGSDAGLTYAMGNLRPEAGSPCVDAGFWRGGMSAATDLDGRPRVCAQKVDMGCYELPGAGTLFVVY